MPHKLALANCKRFNLDVIEYYRFKLAHPETLEAYLDNSTDEVIDAIWDEVDYCPDGDNSEWEKAVELTAQHLKSIGYEFN